MENSPLDKQQQVFHPGSSRTLRRSRGPTRAGLCCTAEGGRWSGGGKGGLDNSITSSLQQPASRASETEGWVGSIRELSPSTARATLQSGAAANGPSGIDWSADQFTRHLTGSSVPDGKSSYQDGAESKYDTAFLVSPLKKTGHSVDNIWVTGPFGRSRYRIEQLLLKVYESLKSFFYTTKIHVNLFKICCTILTQRHFGKILLHPWLNVYHRHFTYFILNAYCSTMEP